MSHQPESNNPAESSKPAAKPFIIAATVALAIAAGSAYYHYVLSPTEKPTATAETIVNPPQKPALSSKPETDAKQVFDEPEDTLDKPATPPIAQIETAAADPLPELDNSDSVAHNRIENLLPSSFSANLGSLLTFNSEFIRKLVLSVDNLSRGEISNKYPAAHIRVTPFDQSVSAVQPLQDPARYTMTAETFARYDLAVDMFAGIDKASLAALYQWAKPILQEAYDELGNAEPSFDKVAIKAIDQLLSAPNIEGEIELIRPSVMFKYADPALEQSSASDKMMYRLGAENRRKFKAALRDFKTELARL